MSTVLRSPRVTGSADYQTRMSKRRRSVRSFIFRTLCHVKLIRPGTMIGGLHDLRDGGAPAFGFLAAGLERMDTLAPGPTAGCATLFAEVKNCTRRHGGTAVGGRN